MNPYGRSAEDDVRFDRLVDGEISDTERWELLAALDDEPGGWRRCAMAFLEAQAWRQSMQVVPPRNGSLGSDESPGVPARPMHSTTTERNATIQPDAGGRDATLSTRPGVVGLVLAMAVCGLLAFFLGLEFRQRWLPGPKPPAPLAQQELPLPEAPSAVEPLPEEPLPAASEVIPWGAATFVMDDEGREVEVPVFDLDPQSRQVLLENSTAAFDDLRHQFQRRGFEVRRRVRWSPVEMGGGRQMIVPVGDFEISPISHHTVQ